MNELYVQASHPPVVCTLKSNSSLLTLGNAPVANNVRTLLSPPLTSAKLYCAPFASTAPFNAESVRVVQNISPILRPAPDVFSLIFVCKSAESLDSVIAPSAIFPPVTALSAIFPPVTALSAIFPPVTALSAIFSSVTALFAI